MFQGRLSFPTLVCSLRLSFEVDYVSRATMYRVITVLGSLDWSKILENFNFEVLGTKHEQIEFSWRSLYPVGTNEYLATLTNLEI